MKVIMGGKFNITCLFFRILGERVLGKFGGNWGEKAIKRPYKAFKNIDFYMFSFFF